METRIKIDANSYSSFPFAVFVRRTKWRFWGTWEKLDSFKTIEEARVLAQKVSALPEYF